MTKPSTKPPGPEFGAGHTAQYITLAEGLRQAAEAIEADLAYLEKKGLSHSVASLRLEARCATITVLSAALCECVANTVLASVCTPAEFAAVEKSVRMPRKWTHEIPRVLNCLPPSDSVARELWHLHETRNSIVHTKATIFSSGDTVHIQGNDPQWDHLTPEVARSFVTLPLRAAATIPDSADFLLQAMVSSLQERQPRLPRIYIGEILDLLTLIPPQHRKDVRRALDRMDAEQDSRSASGLGVAGQ